MSNLQQERKLEGYRLADVFVKDIAQLVSEATMGEGPEMVKQVAFGAAIALEYIGSIPHNTRLLHSTADDSPLNDPGKRHALHVQPAVGNLKELFTAEMEKHYVDTVNGTE